MGYEHVIDQWISPGPAQFVLPNKKKSAILPKATPMKVPQMFLEVEQQHQLHRSGRKWHLSLYLFKNLGGRHMDYVLKLTVINSRCLQTH